MLKGHCDAIRAVTILNENYIASGSDDKTVRVWNISTGKCEHILEGHTESITALVKKDNGDIASISDDNTFSVWPFGYVDARQDEEQAIIPANKMRI